jgi:hypothetical protein
MGMAKSAGCDGMSFVVATLMSEDGIFLPLGPVPGLQPTMTTSEAQAKDVLMMRLLLNERAELETMEARILDARSPKVIVTPREGASVRKELDDAGVDFEAG